MEDNIKKQKSILRKEILFKRDSLSEAYRQYASGEMTDTVLQQKLYRESENVLCFVSYGSEIDTFPFMQEVINSGKKLFVPKICRDEMIFVRIYSFEDLQPGYKGILEPAEESEVYLYDIKTGASSLLLMPGVAFDSRRHRMGYGKGFYDRYLSNKELLLKRSIAVGFRCQMIDEIPSDDFDMNPAKILVF